MRFTDQALDELRNIYRDEFRREITRDEAAEIAARVVALVQLLRRPLPDTNTPPRPSADL